MKRILYLIILCAMSSILVISCGEKKDGGKDQQKQENKDAHDGDSTIYGVCGMKSNEDSLTITTESGDSMMVYLFTEPVDTALAAESAVYGGIIPGDKLALIAYKDGEGKMIGRTVINLNTLKGRWANGLDRDFSIQEDGQVLSYLKADTNPFRKWSIRNGKLVLDNTEYSIDELSDSQLSIEDSTGIYDFTRKK